MDYTLALLFSLLQLLSVGTAAPVPVEVVKMKSKVKWMAEQLVVRLDKDFQVMCNSLCGDTESEAFTTVVFLTGSCVCSPAVGPCWPATQPTS